MLEFLFGRNLRYVILRISYARVSIWSNQPFLNVIYGKRVAILVSHRVIGNYNEIFRKTNISYSLIAHLRVRIRG